MSTKPSAVFWIGSVKVGYEDERYARDGRTRKGGIRTPESVLSFIDTHALAERGQLHRIRDLETNWSNGTPFTP